MRSLLLFLLVLPLFSKAQTCIVIAYDSTQIFIGADSRQTHFVSDDSMSIDSVCKIHYLNDFYFTSFGRSGSTLVNIAKQLSYPGMPARTLAMRFSLESEQLMTSNFASQRQLNPAFFDKQFTSDTIASVYICKFENNLPEVYQIQFYFRSRSPLVVKSDAKRHKPGSDGFGSIAKTGNYCFSNINRKVDIKSEIIRIINAAAGCNDIYVGLPLSIIRVTPNGFEFICVGLCK